jgi:hypothetical protein
MRSLSVHRTRLDGPAQVPAVAARAVREAHERSHAILCTYTLAGDVLSLGRHHVVPSQAPSSGVGLARRLGGGRAAPLGAGFAGVVLALPRRASLLAPGTTLVPEQILNRYVRGLLGALESLGARAYYPGRDLVTIDGRIAASMGFELAADGTTIVEMSIAVTRSFACVSRFADRVDPAGVVPIALVLDEQAACIADVAGRAPDLEELATALAAGYASRLGCDATVGDALGPLEPDDAWLEAGRLAPHLDRHAAGRDLLGVVEVYAARAGDRVDDVRIGGDVLAASDAVARLEAAVRGAPIERDVLRRRVAAALAGPDDVLLGVRDPATIADLVFEACRS